MPDFVNREKVLTEIQLFKDMLAPTIKQFEYLQSSEYAMENEIRGTSRKSKQSLERCLLVAICGELTATTPDYEKAEFVTRLLLLDLLLS